MPRLRRLTAREIVRILEDAGFEVDRTRGSHATLVRISATGARQVVTVPMHRQLALGTVHAIYRRVSRLVPEADLRAAFFTD